MFVEEEYWADTPFFDRVELEQLWPLASLESVSKLKSRRTGHETDAVARYEEAWRTPFRDLTCDQVRQLLVQKSGLEWLAGPILEFTTNYPRASITNYPGEMVWLTLRAATEMRQFAQLRFEAWLAGDFSWMGESFDFNEELRTEAMAALQAARRA